MPILSPTRHTLVYLFLFNVKNKYSLIYEGELEYDYVFLLFLLASVFLKFRQNSCLGTGNKNINDLLKLAKLAA